MISVYIIGAFVCILIVVGVYQKWYYSTDHWHKDKGIAVLREDAEIIDVQDHTVGNRSYKTIQTTVRFEDGFRYVSHKHERKDYLVFGFISMTDELREEIIQDARHAHATEIALRDGKIK